MPQLNGPLKFDRAFLLTSEEQIAEFSKDPENYLIRLGFFEGMRQFSGFKDSAGADIADVSSIVEAAGAGQMVILGHLGVPYDYPYYCSCVCEVR